MANTYTFLKAYSAVYERLRQSPSTSTNNAVYPITQVKQWINDAHTETLNERHYPFMAKEVYFNCVADTFTTSEVNVGDTSIDVNDGTKMYQAGGVITIENDIINYTSITGNTLNGVTGISAKHSSGLVVKQAYRLSNDLTITDLKKSISLTINSNDTNYYDFNGVFDENGYTVFNDILFLPSVGNILPVSFKYKKVTKVLVNDSDTFDIPDDYITLVVEFALYKCHINVDDTRSVIAFQEYDRVKQKMRRDFAEQHEQRVKKVRLAYKKLPHTYIWR